MLKRLLVLAAIVVLLIGAQTGKGYAATNLVTNGSFETGDFTGWTLSGGVSFAYVSPGGVSGNYEALLGTGGSMGSISQTIGTAAGQAYTVSFWLANDDFTGSNQFEALWNGSVVNTLPAVQDNAPAFDYTGFTYTGLATGSSSTIAFDFQNDSSVFHLDNVSATAPEPAIILLLGPGLAGLAGLRYRMREAA